MNYQIKDKFYDGFLKSPSKDNFRKFLKENCGELNEIDFKLGWIDKGQLSKMILSMANSHGGIIVVGVNENEDGTLSLEGLAQLKDKADINNEISKYVPPGLDYEVFDFVYDASEYTAVENKKFQLLIIHDTPERLPFISMKETTGLKSDTIYIRRGTKCEIANAHEIEKMLEAKIQTIFKESSNLSLEEHLNQLKILYSELPQKINVLVRKGKLSQSATTMLETLSKSIGKAYGILGEPDQYEEIDNPNYPEESYEAFIVRMIQLKKLKIEKFLDLK